MTVVRLASTDRSIQVAVLPEFGARLHRLAVFGQDLLRTPMTRACTCAPNGLRRFLRGEPDGLTLLAPGETLALAVQLAFAASSRSGDDVARETGGVA